MGLKYLLLTFIAHTFSGECFCNTPWSYCKFGINTKTVFLRESNFVILFQAGALCTMNYLISRFTHFMEAYCCSSPFYDFPSSPLVCKWGSKWLKLNLSLILKRWWLELNFCFICVVHGHSFTHLWVEIDIFVYNMIRNKLILSNIIVCHVSCRDLWECPR